jgi:predicted O-methyltransferase YrrM
MYNLRYAEKIPTYTSIEQLRTLLKLATYCEPYTLGIEIGSYYGASSCFIAAGLCLNHGNLICVDTWNNETMPEGKFDTYEIFLRNIEPLKNNIFVLRKRSEELTAMDIPSKIGYVFIDGDHSYEATRKVFNFLASHLTENAVVCFHDVIYYQGVAKVVGECLASGNWTFGGSKENLIWLYNRKPIQ